MARLAQARGRVFCAFLCFVNFSSYTQQKFCRKSTSTTCSLVLRVLILKADLLVVENQQKPLGNDQVSMVWLFLAPRCELKENTRLLPQHAIVKSMYAAVCKLVYLVAPPDFLFAQKQETVASFIHRRCRRPCTLHVPQHAPHYRVLSILLKRKEGKHPISTVFLSVIAQNMLHARVVAMPLDCFHHFQFGRWDGQKLVLFEILPQGVLRELLNLPCADQKLPPSHEVIVLIPVVSFAFTITGMMVVLMGRVMFRLLCSLPLLECLPLSLPLLVNALLLFIKFVHFE
mmetsp:Transcript_32925/g.39859  ORF Transcript_32925/g.39859 Transcript_32925/m.39859 type:complete len:287 (+) Transcript_32925:204-1064(+)